MLAHHPPRKKLKEALRSLSLFIVFSFRIFSHFPRKRRHVTCSFQSGLWYNPHTNHLTWICRLKESNAFIVGITVCRTMILHNSSILRTKDIVVISVFLNLELEPMMRRSVGWWLGSILKSLHLELVALTKIKVSGIMIKVRPLAMQSNSCGSYTFFPIFSDP